MKNYLVILVVLGIGFAYWYQMPDAPKPVVATPTPLPPPLVPVVVATPRPVFHSALDQPATKVGNGGDKAGKLYIGTSNPDQQGKH